MTLTRVLHQQVMQLRWHLLACLGLIMVLPIEEWIVNLRDRDGHFQVSLAIGVLFISPLLAALIACANVQADLDEKRDPFWRSKPVNVTRFISVKFIVGLLLALSILACPVLFTLIITTAFQEDLPEAYWPIVFNIILVSMLTYSLGFLCNVIVRKSARAWLIGMALACFVILIPFLLPLQFKDLASDFLERISGIYLALTLGLTALGFVLANLAAQRHWHIQTNTKGLLWAAAALVFVLTLMMTRQIANIRVLDETPVHKATISFVNPIQVGNQVILPGQKSVTTAENKLVFKEIPASLEKMTFHPYRALLPYSTCPNDLNVYIYPRAGYGALGGLPIRVGDQTYTLVLFVGYREEKIQRDSGMTDKVRYYEKLMLRSFKSRPFFTLLDKDTSMEPLSLLDLSDTLIRTQRPHLLMRLIGNRLMVAVDSNLLEFHIADNGQLQQVANERYDYRMRSSDTEPFKINLAPVNNLDIRDHIRLSIDLSVWLSGPYYRHFQHELGFERFSLVDIDSETIRFATIAGKKIHCYEVLDWDQESMRCRLHSTRHYNWWEPFHQSQPHFVRDGKFYTYGWDRLLVFDLRSKRGLRKLGHFQRLHRDFHISQVLVVEDGNILLFNERWKPIEIGGQRDHERFLDIILLKNPQS